MSIVYLLRIQERFLFKTVGFWFTQPQTGSSRWCKRRNISTTISFRDTLTSQTSTSNWPDKTFLRHIIASTKSSRPGISRRQPRINSTEKFPPSQDAMVQHKPMQHYTGVYSYTQQPHNSTIPFNPKRSYEHAFTADGTSCYTAWMSSTKPRFTVKHTITPTTDSKQRRHLPTYSWESTSDATVYMYVQQGEVPMEIKLLYTCSTSLQTLACWTRGGLCMLHLCVFQNGSCLFDNIDVTLQFVTRPNLKLWGTEVWFRL